MFLSGIAPVYETKKIFYGNFGRELSLDNPRDINEKIQYLKFNQYYKNQIVTDCIDKYRIRQYLTKKGLESICPELYGVYKRPNQIDWDRLPDSFVVKCNHGCGYNIICPNKKQLDVKDAEKKLKKWLKAQQWKEYSEVQYKYIKRNIIIEQYLGDVKTYKFYCFNGVPKVLYVSSDGEDGTVDLYLDYYDMEFNWQDIHLGGHLNHPDAKKLTAPAGFDRMKELAVILSKDFPFVRVDLYNVDGKVYISELTFVPTGGFMHLEPEETLYEWGSWLSLN